MSLSPLVDRLAILVLVPSVDVGQQPDKNEQVSESAPLRLWRWATAIGAEFFCTILVAVGIVHWADPFGKKEFALLYMVPFLTLILTGGGRYSIDGWLARRRASS